MAVIDKNTVDANNQLKSDLPIFYENKDNKGLHVLFVGNSISIHGLKPEIGWYGENYGMAASKKENDYVHLMISKFTERDKNSSFCICHVSNFEKDYKNGEKYLGIYKEAREFDADIIIMRMCENCPRGEWDSDAFKNNYTALIDYLNPAGKAQVILTTGFWKHDADDDILSVGAKRGYKTVYLGELGELDEMKALDRFGHGGVAIHPGDRGMQAISQMIYDAIEF